MANYDAIVDGLTCRLRGGKYHHLQATVPPAAPTGIQPIDEAA